MDSIRQNRTKEDILTEIRMERAHDIFNEKCYIIVEGPDDVLFTKKMVCDNVVCLESFAGKTGLQEIIGENDMMKDDIIGIRDRDYMDETDLQDRIFLYDHCCLEMMLLAERVVAESFHQIYYKGRSQCDFFILNAMRKLSPYSILRRKNEKESLRIKFKKVNFGDLVDLESESLDVSALFHRINEDERYNGCRQEADGLNDLALWEITNGHDICMFLGRLSKSGKKHMSESDVRNILLATYRKEDFFKTQLCQSLLCYQRQKHLKFLEDND